MTQPSPALTACWCATSFEASVSQSNAVSNTIFRHTYICLSWPTLGRLCGPRSPCLTAWVIRATTNASKRSHHAPCYSVSWTHPCLPAACPAHARVVFCAGIPGNPGNSQHQKPPSRWSSSCTGVDQICLAYIHTRLQRHSSKAWQATHQTCQAARCMKNNPSLPLPLRRQACRMCMSHSKRWQQQQQQWQQQQLLRRGGRERGAQFSTHIHTNSAAGPDRGAMHTPVDLRHSFWRSKREVSVLTHSLT